MGQNEKRQSVYSTESISEKFDRFARGFDHIQQRWDNRLSRKGLSLWEGYINSDFSILLEFDIVNPSHQFNSFAKRAVAEVGYEASTLKRDTSHLSEFNNRNDKVVLVRVVKLGNGPEQVISVNAVGLHLIEDKRLNIGEGLMYRRLSNGVFDIFPRLCERKRVSPPFARCAPQRRPNMVKGASEVVNTVANDERDFLGVGTQVGEFDDLPTVSVFSDGNFVSVHAPEVIHTSFKLVDVAFGPYNL